MKEERIQVRFSGPESAILNLRSRIAEFLRGEFDVFDSGVAVENRWDAGSRCYLWIRAPEKSS